MTRCVIHIGMHKTGSTSIQGSLQGFRDDRFLYADLGGGGNHSLAIYSLFAANPAGHHLHRTRNAEAVRAYIRNARSNLKRSISATEGRALLISGEDIGVLPQPSLSRLREYLRRHFDEIEVMAYVRPPAAFMTSSFQQRIKTGGFKRFDLDRLYRNYRPAFEKFDAVFGRENVQLWKFDPTVFPDGCVVQDFCARLGIALPSQRILRLNGSLSRRAVALLYTYRNFGEKYGASTMKGGQAVKLGLRLAGEKFRLSPDLLRPILEKNRSDLEWMEARLGQPLEEEIGDHRPGDVREEWDLLRPDPKAVSDLLGLLGESAPKGVRGETPDEVAQLVHALREQQAPERGVQGLARRARRLAESLGRVETGTVNGMQGPANAGTRQNVPTLPGDSNLEISKLLEEIQRTDPNLLRGIPLKAAQALVSHAFKHVSQTLMATEEGVVTYSGLGRFRVTTVEQGVEGTKTIRTRIGFRPAERSVGQA